MICALALTGCSTAELTTATSVGGGLGLGALVLNRTFFFSNLFNVGTHVEHSEHFAAVDDNGKINFYRTDVRLDSTNGQTRLVAGWHDRFAFDSLGTIIGIDDQDGTLTRRGSSASGNATTLRNLENVRGNPGQTFERNEFEAGDRRH